MATTGRGKTGTGTSSTKKASVRADSDKNPKSAKGTKALRADGKQGAELAKAKAQKTSPAKGVTTRKGTSKAGVLVGAAHKISEANQRRAESLLAEINRRKERIAEDFYEMGLALRELLNKELFRALGYSSFKVMLAERNVVAYTTAYRLIQLVSTMSRDEALAYGQEKAAALLEYAKATPEVDTPKSLVESGKLPDGKLIAKASVRDLKAAAKHVRKSTGEARVDPASKEASTEAKALQTWLHSRGARGASVEAVRSKGAYVLRVEMSLAASGKLRES